MDGNIRDYHGSSPESIESGGSIVGTGGLGQGTE